MQGFLWGSAKPNYDTLIHMQTVATNSYSLLFQKAIAGKFCGKGEKKDHWLDYAQGSYSVSVIHIPKFYNDIFSDEMLSVFNKNAFQ